jgi:hypothetical protein
VEEVDRPGKAYLRAKEEHIDLGPVIENYANTAAAFFNWFVEEINKRNAEIKTAYNAEIKTAYAEAAEAYVECTRKRWA